MQPTGFKLVDGSPAHGIAAATPRHWVLCAAFVIVAQWMLGMLSSATNFAVGVAGYQVSGIAFASVAWLIFPFAIVGTLTIYLSQRFDHRGVAAFGLHKRALIGAAPWVLAGLVASGLTIASFFAHAPGWGGQTLEALLWLTPATIIQAGVEEILFRGVLLTMLVARYGAAGGVLISAALFALWHIYAGQGLVDAGMFALTTFVFGVSSAILVLHQGHLGGAIALHVVWNLVIAVDAGLQHWTGDSGVLGMFNSFWQSYLATIDEPWTLESLMKPETLRFTFFPLVVETLIVFAACRVTFDKIFGPRYAAEPESAK